MDLPNITWGANGLVSAIAQDVYSGKILMQAWMNEEALQRTIVDGYATYWSRSRNKIWKKGETSGDFLKLVDIYIDCDADCILLQVEAVSGIACHTGTASCFNRRLEWGSGRISEQACEPHPSALAQLEHTIMQRAKAEPASSYTAALTAAGVEAVRDKVREESLELLQASLAEGNRRVIEESADLWYHMLVLLHMHGITMQQVSQELKNRTRQGGLEEKTSRNKAK